MRVAEPEIHYLDVVVLVEEEEVLGFQVPMDDVHFVDFVHSRQDLVEEADRLALLHPAVRNDVVEKLPAASILHDEIQLSRCLDDFIELHHVGMPNELQDVDLAGHAFDISDINDAFLLKDLY